MRRFRGSILTWHRQRARTVWANVQRGQAGRYVWCPIARVILSERIAEVSESLKNRLALLTRLDGLPIDPRRREMEENV